MSRREKASASPRRLSSQDPSESDDPAWLVSRSFDLAIFGAPAAVALALVSLEPWLAPDGDTPWPMWLIGVLAVDVAHVWATLYRTYLDRRERVRLRRWLIAAPLGALLGSALLLQISHALFWSVLAYLAVFHFVRQQYGWVALYHRRDPGIKSLDRWLDCIAIYSGTLYPLIWWHAHLPRAYVWFVEGDFVPAMVPQALSEGLYYPYVGVFVAFVFRQLYRVWLGHAFWTGKVVVVVTTALCWGVGILVTNTDWAFTVTNVLIHGVPYFGIVWVRSGRPPVGAFYGLLFFLAAMEELGWWVGERRSWAMTVLAVPQVTHYVLDGVIWRTMRRRP